MPLLLAARGLVGLWFGFRILQLAPSSWGVIFNLLADYLLVDGALALAVSVLFLREGTATDASRERNLGVVLLIDGLGRTVSGLAVHAWPGLPDFPVTATIFLVVMAVCTAAVGLTEATLVLREEAARHGRQHSAAQLPAVPIGAASIVSLIFGVGAVIVVGDPRLLHFLLAGFILSAGVVMLVMAWSRSFKRL